MKGSLSLLELHPNFVVMYRIPGKPTLLVAEIVKAEGEFLVYRMDITSHLGSGFASAGEALNFFETWFEANHANIEGVALA